MTADSSFSEDPPLASTGSTDDDPPTSGTSGSNSDEAPKPGTCGNGVVDVGEECDDGNLTNSDDCLTSCIPAKCGDGFVWDGIEDCDDGNADETDACRSSCVSASCGDGIVEAGIEQCDDANGDDSDGCTSLCRLAACGDGLVHIGVEECDEKEITPTCDGDCTAPGCGDGYVNQQAGEECDDGNQSSLDNCYPNCTAPTMLVFVTSQKFQGDLGGIDGADTKCQTIAASGNLKGTFKAWLWADNIGPAETFYHSLGRYMRPDKVIVAENFAQLLDGPLLAQVIVTEKKQFIDVFDPDRPPWQAAWTGAAPNGFDLDDIETDCDDWTSSSDQRLGIVNELYKGGLGGLGDNNQGGGYNCKLYQFPIVCVQQAWYMEDPEPG